MDEEDKKEPVREGAGPLSESIFKEDAEWLELNKGDWERSVRRGKNTLFIIGILILLSEVISVARSGETLGWGTWLYIAVASGVFIVLGIFANRSKPYTVLLIGLFTFIAYIIGVVGLHAFVFGTSEIFRVLFSGILFKGLAIYMLVKALPGAKKLQHYYEKTLMY